MPDYTVGLEDLLKLVDQTLQLAERLDEEDAELLQRLCRETLVRVRNVLGDAQAPLAVPVPGGVAPRSPATAASLPAAA